MREIVDLDRAYFFARIARGWQFRCVKCMCRHIVVAPGTPREEVERFLTAVLHTQALLDARHALN